MKTIKDTPGRDKETSKVSKVVFNQVQNKIIMQEEEAVIYCEKEYPETCQEFKNIMAEQYVLFCKILGHKDNVGESELDTFQDLSVYGIIAQIVSAKKWGK